MTVQMQMHLPCDNNMTGRVAGRSDQRVSAFGKMLAGFVQRQQPPSAHLAAVVSSPLPRAVETARLCHERSGLPLIVDERLTCVDYGTCHGVSLEQIHERFASHVAVPYPGGESYEQMRNRYQEALDALAERYPNAGVLMIGHNDSLAILHHLCEGRPLLDAIHESMQLPALSGMAAIVEYYAAFHGPFQYRRCGAESDEL